MTVAQETRDTPAVPTSAEVRLAALEQAVAELTAEGWGRETKLDNERVLVGHNEFRRLLVRRQWGVRNQRQLVDVDKHGEVRIRPV
jgi:hypothetical protein